MGYIGKAHQSTSVPARTVSMLTGDGTTTTLTLSQAPMSANNVSVFFDGVAQTPGTDYTLSGSTLTFTSVPPAACVVCAIVGGGENISSPMGGSITAESIVAGAITNAKIASVDTSKLTGTTLPALDASNVTFAAQQNIFTKSAADPTETSNVTLGTIWVNTLSGEIFVCIDATTDQNSYMNVGTGTLSIFGNVIPGEPTDNVPDMDSSTSVSHTFTGGTDTDGTVTHYHVDQISDVNLLSVAAAEVAAGSSHVFTSTSVSADTNVTFRVRTKDNDGAYSNGITVTVIVIAPWAYGGTIAGFQAGGRDMASVNQNINKIDFSTGSNSSLGVKTLGLMWGVNGNSSPTHGYIFGGAGGAYGSYAMYTEKFSFTSYAQSSNIANLTEGVNEPAGHNTEHHGWKTGGAMGGSPYRSNRADKISFASDTSWTHTNTLNYIRKAGSGMSSLTYGYTAGGHVGNPTSLQAVQEKFSFSSNGGSTNVADLIQARETAAGCSSGTHGYSCGGWSARIERINFSNDNEQTDVAMLSPANHAAKGASSSTTHGYLAGGWYDDTVSKFSFASATPSIELLPNIPHHAYHGASGLQY